MIDNTKRNRKHQFLLCCFPPATMGSAGNKPAEPLTLNLFSVTQWLELAMSRHRCGLLPAIYRPTGTSVLRVRFAIRRCRQSDRDSNRVELTPSVLTPCAPWTLRALSRPE